MYGLLYADKTGTEYGNIINGNRIKMLMPKPVREKTGMNEIRGTFMDGCLITADGTHDIYELFAIWNGDMYIPDDEYSKQYFSFQIGKQVKELIDEYDKPLKTVNRFSANNRKLGIELAQNEAAMNRMLYPLKLTHLSNDKLYEYVPFPSYTDPFHGTKNVSWNDIFNNWWFNKTATQEFKDYVGGETSSSQS